MRPPDQTGDDAVTSEPPSNDGDVVRLSVPASPRHAATARMVAASLAADAGFDVDEIDDLRLAVNEAIAVMTDDLDDAGDSDDTGGGDRHEAPARVEIEFRASGSTIEVDLRRTGAASDIGPDALDELATTILSAVVDRHEIVDGCFRLTKTAGAAAIAGDR